MSSLNGLPFALVSDSYLTQESTDSALKGCIKARLRQQQNMHELQSCMKNRKKNICEVAMLVFFSGVNSQRAVEMNAAEGTASALLTDEPAADLTLLVHCVCIASDGSDLEPHMKVSIM